jgi:tRNA A-37 threonylcarbamoyl transferase component Bud32
MIVANIHANGVLHGDLRPANVLCGSRGIVLIDFSHSDTNHVCPQDMPCWELESVRSQLDLKDEELGSKWTWIAFEWQMLRRRLLIRSLIGQHRRTTAMLTGAVVVFPLIS